MIAIFLVIVLLSLIYFQFPLIISMVVMGGLLGAGTFLTQGHLLLWSISWFLWLAAFTFLLCAAPRRRFLTGRLVNHLESRMPSISKTEREALEAGDPFWEKELFSGAPRWKNLLSLPAPCLSDREQAFMDHEVDTLCAMLDDWEIANVHHDLPPAVWSYLKQAGFFGMIIPENWGGLGFSAMAHSSIVARIATRSISAAVNVMVPNSLGPAELLLHYGTEAQKSWYLPRLARGEEIPCFALTGPEAGSDAASLTDTGVVCKGMHEGQEVTGICLNWDKRYITLAPVATVIGVAVQLEDPDNLLGKGARPGITLCLVPAAHSGVESGQRHLPLHLAFMNGPVRGKNVFVPLDWIIGGPAMAGEGWRMLMECLSAGRGISLPALSAACGHLVSRMTGGYARLRRQFNVPISSFEGITEALGHIAGLTWLLESTRQMTVMAIDQKIRPAMASAITKYHMTEMARKVVNHAMDIHAGHAIQLGPENFLAPVYFSLPVSITVEGANILTRNLIIFGQGAIRCHPFLLQEVRAFAEPPSPERLVRLDRLLISHAGRIVGLFVRTVWQGLTGGRLIRSPKKDFTARYYRQLTRMSTALAFLSEMTLALLAGELKRRERLSARLGDILSQLYLASAVLKRFHDRNSPSEEADPVHWSLAQCLSQIQTACDDLLLNFPWPWLGRLLLRVVFPYGRVFYPPSDRLHARVAALITEPSALRDQLTHLFYQEKSGNTPSVRIEAALRMVASVEPLLKKIQKAVQQGELNRTASFEEKVQKAVKLHILESAEANRLCVWFDLYQDVIRVDEFSHDLQQVLTTRLSGRSEEVA